MVMRVLRTGLKTILPAQVLSGLVTGLLVGCAVISFSVLVFKTSSLSSGTNSATETIVGPRTDNESDRRSFTFQGTMDRTVATQLAQRVKVLIWVMTSPHSLDDRATMVRQTWGRRVEKLLFFSSDSNENFPTIGLNVSEGRDHLTAKTIQGFRYIYDHHLHDADWFMKVDDDTFVVVENLLYFLSEEDPQDSVYFGHLFGRVVSQGYNSGGGGYVLSKEALRRFGEKGQNSSVCKQDGGAEDAEFGKCMERLGVKTANTTDALGRSRFHCFDVENHVRGALPQWYRKYDANGAKEGLDSVSDYAITFHYVYPAKMQRLEFYIYHLQAYGVRRGLQKLNKPRKDRAPIRPIYRQPP